MNRIGRVLRALVLAVGFTSILPAPMFRPRRVEFALAVAWFPLCGAILGALLLAAWRIMPGSWNPVVQAAVVVALLAWLTRGLHLDGVVDTADGIGGGRGDRERTLTIMKDPRAGAFGVIAVTLVLILKVAALAGLLERGDWIAVLLFPCAARGAGALLPVLFPSARPDGLGRLMIPRSRTAALVAVCGITGGLLGAGAVVVGAAIPVFAAAGVAALLVLWLGWRWSRVLRGLTGDTYGAAIECAEVVFLLAML